MRVIGSLHRPDSFLVVAEVSELAEAQQEEVLVLELEWESASELAEE
jgi:hypothetical protein